MEVGIILVILILICIALEAGEVEATLSYFSAMLQYVFPVPRRPVYILPTVFV